MKRSRTQKPREPGSLKEAEVRLVEAVGGLEAAADIAGVSSTMMHRYTDTAETNAAQHMPLTKVIMLEQSCGQSIVTRYMLGRIGFVPTAIAQMANADPVALLVVLAREGGAFFGDALQSLCDGNLDRAEAGRLLSQAMHLAAEFQMLASALGSTIETMKGGDK